MAQGLKQKTVTIETRCTNTLAISNILLSSVPQFVVAFAYKDRDYSITPSTENDCLELCGINNTFISVVRYRNGSYATASVASSYDGVAEVGESYIVCYK